jgi:crossover junction endodeoxyribonuclease RuvC
VDPGTIRVGFGLVGSEGGRLRLEAHGVIAAPRTAPLAERLGRIATELARVLDDHRPDAVAVEEAFFGRNVRSAIRIGEGRGVALALAAARGIPVFEYTARSAKKTAVGHGGAAKAQVGWMIARFFPDAPRLPADAADAVALSLCHLFRARHPHVVSAVGRRRRPGVITSREVAHLIAPHATR